MDALRHWCNEQRILLIEDCALALFQRRSVRKHWSDRGCFDIQFVEIGWLFTWGITFLVRSTYI